MARFVRVTSWHKNGTDCKMLTINVDAIAFVEIDSTTPAKKPTIQFVGGSSVPVTNEAWNKIYPHLGALEEVAE